MTCFVLFLVAFLERSLRLGGNLLDEPLLDEPRSHMLPVAAELFYDAGFVSAHNQRERRHLAGAPTPSTSSASSSHDPDDVADLDELDYSDFDDY